MSKINVDEIKKSNFLRVAIEAEVIKTMIEKYDREALKRLEANLKKQESVLEDYEKLFEFDELDKEFHSIMFESVGQEELNDLLRSKMGHKKRANRLELPKNGKVKNFMKTIKVYMMQ